MSESSINAKKEVINEIKEKIQNAKSVTLVEFNGMDVLEVTDLRNNFRQANSEYKVYKNTMMRFAFEELGYDQFAKELKGSNALIFSNEEVVDGPKVAINYIDKKDENKEKLIFKSGIVDGDYQNPDQMTAIAKLPSTEALLSMLVNVLQAPIRNLAIDLNQVNAKLVYALDAIREKKENEAA
ncbi:MAG: 50S ribosomal protein L10 [Peptoniphilaceae bacterium]|nr:50S ribosomal protein L10 [Peptoniphilaceae bacterium]MDY6019421.1 50S ribosomal protein L10 [Anaerococcus sp.]